MKRKTLLSFLFALLLSLIILPTVQASIQPSVYLNGALLKFDDQPAVIQNGRTLVPLRKIFESLGATVNYDPYTKRIDAYRDSTDIQLTVGSKKALVNGRSVTIDVPANTINGRTLVPLRFISEAMDCVVDWDASNHRVIITDPTINSRSNPASMNQYVHIKANDWWNGEIDIELGLMETIRGSQATTIVQNANMFNDLPDPGYEYILAKFKIRVNKVGQRAYSTSTVYFDALSENGVLYDDLVFVSGLNPDFDSELYPGATHEGWVPFLVKTGEQPLLVYKHGLDQETWFKLN